MYGVDNAEQGSLALSQLFRSGEIWGIDTISIRSEWSNEKGVPYVRTGAVQRGVTQTLDSYLRAARILQLRPPLQVIIGMSGVTGYKLGVPQSWFPDGGIVGHIFKQDVVHEAVVPSLDVDPQALVSAFMEKVYDSAGLEVPASR